MFDAIGEGHKIMNESVKKKVNLNELARLIKKKPVCTDDIMDILCTVPELIAENRALQERVRELERQTVVLANHLSRHVLHTMSTKEWLEWSESVAKEAGK